MVMYCDICGAKIENGEDVNECPECLCPFENVDESSPIKEFKSKIPDGNVVKSISTDESFMNAMVELYQNKPVEYQLKIQQMKTQLYQQKQAEKNNNIINQPHCPTCNSDNLRKISTTSKVMNTAMWGLLGTRRNKTYHCNNCGYEW
ncbi:MAG: hypothetical protein HFH14_05930 [Lachnospiraceae bacterium]|nr:hypothetical protein [Lachnospiraceae bacterium]